MLEVLNLENKQYTNVDSLLQKDLGNLKELCLKGNKLNNEQISILKNLNCHDLLKLNLESNYFTSYLLFTVVPNFNKLQDELSSIEEKISYARSFYNDSVLKYNNKIEMFPSNIIAGMFNFKKKDFFQADETERKNVEVKF